MKIIRNKRGHSTHEYFFLYFCLYPFTDSQWKYLNAYNFPYRCISYKTIIFKKKYDLVNSCPKFSNFRIIQWWDSPKFFRNVFWTQIATSILVYEVLQVSSTVIMNQLVAFCSLKLVHTIV
jgi:hypothetical protein